MCHAVALIQSLPAPPHTYRTIEMPITVNGPNGVTVNFPDGTDADTIHGVMSQATGQSAPTQSSTWAGFTDIPKEVGSAYQGVYDYGKESAGRIADQLN